MPHTQIKNMEELMHSVSCEKRVLCLYSGGLDGAFLLHELNRLGFTSILALTIDVGQPLSRGLAQSIATGLGAEWRSIDAKDDFVENHIFPAIYCHATYLGGHPISASLSRPLMAQKAVQIAIKEGYGCILHTASISQNSLRRFNTAIYSLGYKGIFGSPFALSAISREEKMQILSNIGIHWDSDRHYSVDENLWIHEFEYGECDNPEAIVVPKELLKWTVETATTSKEITIRFKQGIPVELDGVSMVGLELIRRLNTFVGSYGLGRYIWLEELPDGKKVQEIREAPAALILLDAYRRLESAVLSSDQIREKLHIEQLWVREASEGRWFGKLRPACQSFIQKLAEDVNGSVTYTLSSRQLQPIRICAEQPTYIVDREQYEEEKTKSRARTDTA